MGYWHYNKGVPFNTLMGVVLKDVVATDDTIKFFAEDGKVFVMYHEQDCCESVGVESIVGDLRDLVGHPILIAEEVTSSEVQPNQEVGPYDDFFTWTFYKLATIKGYVDIRWFGESNGYYSESVDFIMLDSEDEFSN